MVRNYFIREIKRFFFCLDVENLLASPFFTFDNVVIKCKRTKPMIEKSCFLLKFLNNNNQDTISENRIKLYIDLLMIKHVSYTIVDLSTEDDQMYLIQCENELGKKYLFCEISN